MDCAQKFKLRHYRTVTQTEVCATSVFGGFFYFVDYQHVYGDFGGF
jgi:hypothetical protein